MSILISIRVHTMLQSEYIHEHSSGIDNEKMQQYLRLMHQRCHLLVYVGSSGPAFNVRHRSRIVVCLTIISFCNGTGTFENLPDSFRCGMCDGPRPTSTRTIKPTCQVRDNVTLTEQLATRRRRIDKSGRLSAMSRGSAREQTRTSSRLSQSSSDCSNVVHRHRDSQSGQKAGRRRGSHHHSHRRTREPTEAG